MPRAHKQLELRHRGAIGGFVQQATFSGNTADIGAAAFSETSFTTLGLSGSLFANSTGDHCGGWVADSGGGNLADDGTCLPTIDGSLTGLDPVLSDNGGPTPTHELLAGSSAIDAAGDCSKANDQRGAGRVGDCDSGAFEWIGCNMLELEDLEITLPAIVPGRTCNTAVLGPDLVVRSTGFLWIEAGHQILLKNGFVIQNGGEAQLSIDPSLLLMP